MEGRFYTVGWAKPYSFDGVEHRRKEGKDRGLNACI
jgi:hypothetical protein